MKLVIQYIDNKNFLGKRFEAPTTFLSQVSETEHGGVLGKRTKASRFTEYQLSEMKKRFKRDPNIKGIEKELMVKNLGITQTAVTNWFSRKRRLERNLVNTARNATVVTA